MDRISIWWLEQADYEAIGDELPASFPAYLKTEYESRRGRGGRGRLWVAREFGEVGVDPWPDNAMARRLGGDDFGGIVIHDEHAAFLQRLPGVITDMHLNRVEIQVFA